MFKLVNFSIKLFFFKLWSDWVWKIFYSLIVRLGDSLIVSFRYQSTLVIALRLATAFMLESFLHCAFLCYEKVVWMAFFIVILKRSYRNDFFFEFTQAAVLGFFQFACKITITLCYVDAYNITIWTSTCPKFRNLRSYIIFCRNFRVTSTRVRPSRL